MEKTYNYEFAPYCYCCPELEINNNCISCEFLKSQLNCEICDDALCYGCALCDNDDCSHECKHIDKKKYCFSCKNFIQLHKTYNYKKRPHLNFN